LSDPAFPTTRASRSASNRQWLFLGRKKRQLMEHIFPRYRSGSVRFQKTLARGSVALTPGWVYRSGLGMFHLAKIPFFNLKVPHLRASPEAYIRARSAALVIRPNPAGDFRNSIPHTCMVRDAT
jgi:hypothetical protein